MNLVDYKDYYIKLKKDVFYYMNNKGIYLRNNKGYFLIEVIGINKKKKVICILDLLKRGGKFKELLEKVHELDRKLFFSLFKLLLSRDWLKILENENMTLANSYLKDLIQENNVDYDYAIKKLNKAKVSVIGNSDFEEKINKLLSEVGVNNLNFDRSNINKSSILLCLIDSYESLLEVKEIVDNHNVKVIILANIADNILLFMAKNKDEFYYFYERVTIQSGLGGLKDWSENIYYVLQFQIVKLLTQYTKCELEENYYLIDNKNESGKYYSINICNKYNLYKYIEKFNRDFLEPVINLGRDELVQLPLSQWKCQLRNKDKVINMQSFGITHEEARLNICTDVIENYIKEFYDISKSYEVICTSKDKIIRYGFLKCKYKNVLKQLDNYTFSDLNIDEYLANKDIQYYLEILNIYNEKFKIEFFKESDITVIVRISNKKYSAVNIGLDVEEALINTLSLYIYMIENKTTNYSINISLFKNLDSITDVEKILKSENIIFREVESIFNNENIQVRLVKLEDK